MPEPVPAPPDRRGPGVAVLIILLYAAAFGAGLWWFRSKSPLFHRSTPAPPPTQPAAPSPQP